MARSRKSPAPPIRPDEAVAKRPPGRQRTKTDPPLYPDQLILKIARLKAGFNSQEEFAQEAGISTSYYGEIERGDRRINADTGKKIGRLLPVSGLLGVATTPMVPVRVVIGTQANIQTRGQSFELSEPWEMAPAHKTLQTIADCFAAEIADDSANLDFPAEAILYLRPVMPGEALPRLCPVVVRFFTQPRTETSETAEILYGVLDRTSTGDIVLLTRSETVELPASKLIQTGSPRLRALNARLADAIPWAPEIDYMPRPEDPAEIIGIVLYALTPVPAGNVSRETR